MPPNTISVTRPGPWGNPARVGDYFMVGDPYDRKGGLRMAWCRTSKEHADSRFTFIDSTATAVSMFEKLAATGYFTAKQLDELRGENLACYCPIGSPCHGDVLLKIANKKP